MAAHTASKEEKTSVPKKRLVTKVATKKVAAKRVAAKRIPRRTIDEVAPSSRRIPTNTRKAPTTIPERGPAKHFPFAVALSVGAFVVALGTSAIVGFGGHGAIDVAQVIKARAERVAQQGEGNQDEAAAVAAAASAPASTVPNGGLRGSGTTNTQSEPGPVATDESEQITFVDSASTTADTLPPEAGETPPETQEEVSIPETSAEEVQTAE